MKRTTVFFDELLDADLRALAEQEGRPMALLVREAVSQYVAKNTSEVAGLPSFVAMGKSGHRDTAERHEELLFKDLVPGAAVAPVRRPAKGRRRV